MGLFSYVQSRYGRLMFTPDVEDVSDPAIGGGSPADYREIIVVGVSRYYTTLNVLSYFCAKSETYICFKSESIFLL